MKVSGTPMRSIWLEADGWSVGIIDQTRLPHALVTDRLTTLDAAAEAIRAMRVRGAPLIGATAAYGIALALRGDASDGALAVACRTVAETRPRNQGASLTAWELAQHGVPHTIVVDNVGGHLMQHGKVDLCITGTDRTTATGDVANKIGTYLKALAARDNDVPFYVALPSPTIDWTVRDGITEIPIEERNGSEVSDISGRLPSGAIATVRLIPEGSAVANFAFDVTPSRLVSGLITGRGLCAASSAGLLSLFPERRGPMPSVGQTGT